VPTAGPTSRREIGSAAATPATARGVHHLRHGARCSVEPRVVALDLVELARGHSIVRQGAGSAWSRGKYRLQEAPPPLQWEAGPNGGAAGTGRGK